MKHLGIDEKILIGRNAVNTAKEIEGQPELWKKTWQKIAGESVP